MWKCWSVQVCNMYASLFSSSFSHSILFLFFYVFYGQPVAVASYFRCNLKKDKKDIDYVLPSLFKKKSDWSLTKWMFNISDLKSQQSSSIMWLPVTHWNPKVLKQVALWRSMLSAQQSCQCCAAYTVYMFWITTLVLLQCWWSLCLCSETWAMWTARSSVLCRRAGRSGTPPPAESTLSTTTTGQLSSRTRASLPTCISYSSKRIAWMNRLTVRFISPRKISNYAFCFCTFYTSPLVPASSVYIFSFCGFSLFLKK